MADPFAPERIPITLLTGFLGTGKTTLLKRYLSSQKPGSVAVIVNEYGSTQVDGDLVSFAGDTAALETTNGCLCCTISGDVRSVLLEFANDISTGKLQRFDQLIIETTGLANPMSLFHALTTNPDLNSFYRFDRTVTLVDAIRGEHWLEKFSECRKQILLGDVILLSKTDLIEDPISQRELEYFITRLKDLSPAASIAASDKATALNALKPTQDATQTNANAQNTRETHARHHHDHGVNSFSLTFDGPVDEVALKTALVALGKAYGAELLRVKGFVNAKQVKSEGALLVQGVGGVFQFTDIGVHSPGAQSCLVFITNALSETEAISYLDRVMGETIAAI